MRKLHLHIWDLPSIHTRLKFGSYSSVYEECQICGKLRLAIGGRR